MLKKTFLKYEYVTLDRVAMAEEAENNPIRFFDRFKKDVIPVLACGVEEDTVIAMKNYKMYNPLFGISMNDILVK